MEYLILFFSVMCIAGQFNINKVYQKKFAHGLKNMLFFPFVCGIVNAIFFTLLGFVLYGGFPDFSLFSFLIAIILAVIGTLSAVVGIMIMKYGKISVYSVFMMLGGMILPYFYGVFFLGETLSPFRIIGLIALICALPLSALNPKDTKNKTSSKKYYILCVLIFCINGTVSIISKTHSISISAVPAANFIVYASLWQIVINGVAYYIFSRRLDKSKPQNDTPKVKPNKIYAVLTIFIFAVVSGAGFLFQLISAETVPAVAMFPFITGGSIVLSTVAARIFFKEKVGKPALAGIAMSVCGTLLFLIK